MSKPSLTTRMQLIKQGQAILRTNCVQIAYKSRTNRVQNADFFSENLC